VPDSVSAIVAALRRGIGTNQMMAYLVEMTVRLVELHRVLKPTGSLWLHCDPTASHYLKVVLDAIFGPGRLANEVIWKRSDAHNDAAQGEVLVSAKSGAVNVAQVRDLKGTMERESAPLGLFITLEEPSRPMLEEAATAGVFRTSGVFDDESRARDYPRVQILTIRELLDGKRPQLPLLVMPTYQQAERVQESPGQLGAFG
jgi:hypothetical protein